MATSQAPCDTHKEQQKIAPPLSSIATRRLKQELIRLQKDPPPGITAYLVDQDNLSQWTAQLGGPVDSPYADAMFKISMVIPKNYPMEPPICLFVNPIPFHPNIDEAGRICLDTLKRPPNGQWSPASNLSTVLLSLQLLLQEPNPDDGLSADASRMYLQDKMVWWKEAKRRLQDESANKNDSKREAAAGTATRDELQHTTKRVKL